jgi:hypothetical protein
MIDECPKKVYPGAMSRRRCKVERAEKIVMVAERIQSGTLDISILAALPVMVWYEPPEDPLNFAVRIDPMLSQAQQCRCQSLQEYVE